MEGARTVLLRVQMTWHEFGWPHWRKMATSANGATCVLSIVTSISANLPTWVQVWLTRSPIRAMIFG